MAAVLVYYMLEHTPYGRYLYSIGSNRDAARLVGLRVKRYVLFAFVLSGALAGVAGVLLVVKQRRRQPAGGARSSTPCRPWPPPTWGRRPSSRAGSTSGGR